MSLTRIVVPVGRDGPAQRFTPIQVGGGMLLRTVPSVGAGLGSLGQEASGAGWETAAAWSQQVASGTARTTGGAFDTSGGVPMAQGSSASAQSAMLAAQGGGGGAAGIFSLIGSAGTGILSLFSGGSAGAAAASRLFAATGSGGFATIQQQLLLESQARARTKTVRTALIVGGTVGTLGLLTWLITRK